MIQVLDRLGTKTGIAIAQCISSMEQEDHRLLEAAPIQQLDTDSDIDRLSSPEPRLAKIKRRNGSRSQPAEGTRDQQLEHEERLINAYSKIKQLEEHNFDLVDQLEASKKGTEALEADNKTLHQQLESGRFADMEDESMDILRQQSLQDKDNIAQLEVELAEARSAVEGQERQLDKLSQESEAYHKLQDEVELLRHERDDLRQQSKAIDNLKRKIQTLQEADKSNDASRQEAANAQQELQALRPLKQKFALLQKANEEKTKTIQNGEQEIFDQKTTRRRLDHELRRLTQQVESAKERHKQDQELVTQQQEKIRALQGAPSGEGNTVPASLDDEFAARDQAYKDLQTRNAELVNEVETMKEALSRAAAEGPVQSVDQSAHDLLKARYEKLEKQYLSVYQENLGLEAAVKDVDSGARETGPFVQMRDQLREESEQRGLVEKKVFELEADLSDTKLKLQSIEAKYSAVGQDRDEALKKLQHSASYGNEILHTENTRLLGYLRTFEGDLEEHWSLLKHALLDQDAMLTKDADVRFTDELKLVAEQLKALVANPDGIDDTAFAMTQRIDDSRRQAVTAQSQAAEVRNQSIQVLISKCR